MSPFVFAAGSTLDVEPLAWYVDGGVVLPPAELSVDDDFAVGTVPLESVEESEVRKLALERLRRSLKKGIVVGNACLYVSTIKILGVMAIDLVKCAGMLLVEVCNDCGHMHMRRSFFSRAGEAG